MRAGAVEWTYLPVRKRLQPQVKCNSSFPRDCAAAENRKRTETDGPRAYFVKTGLLEQMTDLRRRVALGLKLQRSLVSNNRFCQGPKWLEYRRGCGIQKPNQSPFIVRRHNQMSVVFQ